MEPDFSHFTQMDTKMYLTCENMHIKSIPYLKNISLTSLIELWKLQVLTLQPWLMIFLSSTAGLLLV